ncbi:hypothetical protein N0M98_23515 [Paenibacillus doosanensis]|uniref:Uncharacterized protein n=1 Tax=Paenibacillus konkukensis TaxID=2020716 RepID=A0ABY4RSJ7_9BACL|nr:MULTISPECIES: hypothetical protein [Paenibacillus]MCS7463099.1 hypothetical protein [Paenibacillus doosanensis]UQZ84508.1 hypothetical protein SK3146_03763 [Paenibacillus konkukensis]
MRYPVTIILAVVGAVLSLVHYFGHESEPIYILFYCLSVPAWFYPIVGYENVNPVTLYTLTILSWAVIGYVVDLFSVRKKSRY